MFNWLRARLGGITAKPMRGLSMVANWLENVKWLIDNRFLSLAQQAFGQNEVVYACIRLLSQSIPEPPLVPYQLDPERGTKTPLPYNCDLFRLIRRPNRLMTEFEFWELLSIHNAIVGRSCWWKERNRMGTPIALWPMRPDRVGPLYDEYKVIRGWAYMVPGTGTIVEIPAEHVAVFNFPDPTGESGGIVEGYGPIQALARQIAADNEATKFVGALLANYAAPTVVIKVKAPIADEDEAALIKAKFRHEFGGANRGTPAVLDAETDIDTIGFDLQQLEFDLLRNISESRIAAALGVPAILVGLRVGLREGNNRASVTEQRSFFAETTLSHHWRRYQDQYTEDIASEFGENIVCEFDTLKVKAMASHIQERLKPIVEAFKNGAITRNQYLMALNLPLLPPVDGDLFLVPSSAVAVPLGASSATALPAGEPQTGGEVGQPIGVLEHGKAAIKAEADFEYQTDAEEELAAIIGAVLTAYWDRGVASVREGQAFPYEDLSAALIAALEPELARIALAQAERDAAATTIGFDPAGMAKQVNEWASSYVSGLVAGLVETTRGVVEQARSKGLGLTDEQIRELLRAGFDEKRATVIGVTETTAAIVGGMLAYQDWLTRKGVRTRLVYRTARDERVCFPANTMVMTKSGNRPIQSLRPGEIVLTRKGYRPVIAMSQRAYEGKFVTIETAQGKVTATADHPFWAERGEWADFLPARVLRRGDSVRYAEPSELNRIAGCVEFALGNADDVHSVSGEKRSFTRVPFGVLVPVIAVHFHDNPEAGQIEIGGIATKLGLLLKLNTNGLKSVTNNLFNARFCLRSPIAGERTISPGRCARATAKLLSASLARHCHAWSSAFLRAVVTCISLLRCQKNLAATGTGFVLSISPSAFERANCISILCRGQNVEGLVTNWADLFDLWNRGQRACLRTKALTALDAGPNQVEMSTTLRTITELPHSLAPLRRIKLLVSRGYWHSAQPLSYLQRLYHKWCANVTLVYNLQVEGDPTYYANGILVHNCPICLPSDGAREGTTNFAYPPKHSNCRCWLSSESMPV